MRSNISVLQRPQLCLVTDPAVARLEALVEQALAAGITMLQVRGHQLDAAYLYALACRLCPLCHQYGALCIVNDRLDVGMAVKADGFQLGRRSLPLSVAREVVGKDYLLGASVHSLEEAQGAVAGGADFLLAETIFPSPSHPDEPVGGPELLRTIKHAYPMLPLLAIGGITAATAGLAMEAGADGVAVISAVLKAPDVSYAVNALRATIGL